MTWGGSPISVVSYGSGGPGEEEKMNTRVTRERFKLSDPRIHQTPELQDSSPERHLFPNVVHWMEARHNPSLGPGKPYVQKRPRSHQSLWVWFFEIRPKGSIYLDYSGFWYSLQLGSWDVCLLPHLVWCCHLWNRKVGNVISSSQPGKLGFGEIL